MESTELNNFKDFLNLNIRSKNVLYDMAFDKKYLNDEEYLVKYSDKFYGQFLSLKNLLLKMADLYFKSDYVYVSSYLNKLESLLISYGADILKINAFYKNYLYDMSPDFVLKVNQNCKGYYICPEINITSAKTINEIIHYMHSYVINSDIILQSIPVVIGEEVEYEKKYYLRGCDTLMGRTLYNNIPVFLKNTIFDIVSYDDDNCIIMARNIGHALSIELHRENGKYFVKYFIPKICDLNMVRNLPGVTSVSENSNYARGQFYINENDFPFELYQFIERVPTDAAIAKRN